MMDLNWSDCVDDYFPFASQELSFKVQYNVEVGTVTNMLTS